MMIGRLVFLSAALVAVHAQQRFECSDPWVAHEDKCYKFAAYPKAQYPVAVAACQKDGAALLSINTMSEHTFVVGYLERTDMRRDESMWLTSGKVSTSQAGGVRWDGDGSYSQGFNFWLNNTHGTDDGASIVYTYSGNEYGWASVRPIEDMSYICELQASQAYRIVQEHRDFDYGLDIKDPNKIPRGPKFIVDPEDTVILGSTTAVFLECVAYGFPTLDYTWVRIISNVRNDLTVTTDSRYTMTNGRLTINHPTVQDEGYYQCEAENTQGTSLSKTVQLSFGTLNDFSNVQVAPVVADEYEGAQLNCPPITVKPAAKYQWYRNSVANFIRPSLQEYIFISNNGKLYFSEVTRQDVGNYHCIVSLTSLGGVGNYIGSSQNPSRTSLGFMLNVNAQPGGNYQPVIQDDFISVFPRLPMKGQDIEMECFAYGTGPLVYSWTRIGRDMPSRATFADHNRVLRIASVAPEDQGKYHCRVYSSKTNQADEKEYTLRIEGEPFFTYPLKDMHVDVGSELTWHCEAAGTPVPTYRWYKNGVQLTNQTGVLNINRNVLRISNLNKERDNGMYQCGATNSHGTVYSTGQMRVLEFAPTFSKHPLERTISATVQGNVTIVCNPEAAPAPTYEWFKDGRNLGLTKGGESGKMRMLMNGNLYISGITQGDQGEYTCKVTNALGEAQDSGYLRVVAETRITRPPSQERVLINATATLVCEASANPNMDMVYSWDFSGHRIDIEKNPHYRMGTGYTQGYLYIINAQFIHDGRYTCNAATGLDTRSASANLIVLGPPGEPAGIMSDDKFDGRRFRSLKILWTDGPDHGSNIMFYDVEFNTNFNRRWRLIKERIPASQALDDTQPSKRQTVLVNLKAGASYKFRVRAMNAYGLGLPSTPTTEIKIQDDKPAKAPERVGGGGGKVGDLTITWEPLPPEDHNGPNLGYIVHWRKRPVGLTDSKWETMTVPGANVGKYVTLVGDENFYSEYEVRVQAYNDLGMGNMSTIATIRSAEDLPIGTPRSVFSDSYNSTALMVFWEPVLDNREFMKGKLLGYKINYWMQDVEEEIDAIQSIYEGQMDHAIIIGLQPDTWYTVNVQVYNSAGNGPKSEDYHQSTDRSAPQLYPTEVHIHSYSSTQVKVAFRGVSTQVYEEPLQGYKVQYWRFGENIRKSATVDAEKDPEVILGNIEKGVIYQMRVFGYSRGGQGKMSSPATLFTLGGEVRIDPSSTDIFAGVSTVMPAGPVIIASLLSAILLLKSN